MTYSEYKPKFFHDFTGQTNIIEDLNVHVKASIAQGRALEHVLMFGPPGLGKTTLARIIAQERGVNIIEKAGTSYRSCSDVDYDLWRLETGDILFIDEIHRLPKKMAELLYTPLESFMHSDDIPLKPFTLIGATNFAGTIDKPLRDRMTHKYEFKEYSNEEIKDILLRHGAPNDVSVDVASRARNTPRIARDLLRKIDNQREFDGDKEIKIKHCHKTFERQDIDSIGLGESDNRILKHLLENGAGSPSRAIGAKALCVALNIDENDFSNMVEPYLIRIGFIQRTSRGRTITKEGIRYIALKK